VVTLPENFSFLGEEADKIAQAAAIAKESVLKTMAQRFQVTVLGGGFPVSGHRQVYNTALLIDPSGQRDRPLPESTPIPTCPTAIPIEIQYGHGWYPTRRFIPLVINFPGTVCVLRCSLPELYRHLAYKGLISCLSQLPSPLMGKTTGKCYSSQSN